MKVLPLLPPGTGKARQLEPVLAKHSMIIVVAPVSMHSTWKKLSQHPPYLWLVSPHNLKDYLFGDISDDPLLVDELHPEQYTDELFDTLRNSGRQVFMIPRPGVPLPISIFDKDQE